MTKGLLIYTQASLHLKSQVFDQWRRMGLTKSYRVREKKVPQMHGNQPKDKV